METSKANETLNEGAKVIEKLFNNTNSAMTDMYKKQMEVATSFYNNLLNSSQGQNNLWSQSGAIPNMFAGVDITKWFSNPLTNYFSNNMQNPFATPMEKGMKQIMEFNQNLISAFTNGINGKNTNWEAIGEEYKAAISARMDASKEILHSITESFNKKIGSSVEINKNTTDEISDQFNKVMKLNQKLWSDMLGLWQAPLNVEEKTKEPVSNENKKRSNVPVNEFMDHKSK
jgi:maltose-binding protein MalE